MNSLTSSQLAALQRRFLTSTHYIHIQNFVAFLFTFVWTWCASHDYLL